ncbi:Cbb3-type cytochrome c oxidase subunit CcoP2 [Novipirellula aureliae]|uniref:Cbb3-type cytochrome c oxidase subunit CcoP2 n=1 Tax=Novipirellula aureliae TaxID=2527966 RepID=A0A5C6EDM2_9BACT|nr:cytochrome c [Novipirellula aureliae]TWU45821.1 Cbb3-type cytochrome c oxidase subunit CcoP2 [Novipirellula aureliae]
MSGSAASTDPTTGFTSGRLAMTDWLFAPIAALLLLFCTLLGLLVVVYSAYAGAEADVVGRALDRGWAIISVVAMSWAVLNLYWSRIAFRHSNATALYSHFSIVIGCGLIALGIHTVLFARAFATGPIVMDVSKRNTGDAGSFDAVVPVATTEGNAEEGQKIFSTTCITCHGPTGDGIANLAPSLRGSEFIATADDAAVAGVIRLGRAATDPNNQSKKVMPARGGNPFLGDDKIVHLVAFIREVQKGGAPAAATGDPNAPPAPLAKWVVPAGPAPPAGMIDLDNRSDVGDAKSFALQSKLRRQLLLQSLSLGLTGIHGLLLFGVMVASSNVLLRRLLGSSAKENSVTGERPWWDFAAWGWIVATGAWLVVFVFGFMRL